MTGTIVITPSFGLGGVELEVGDVGRDGCVGGVGIRGVGAVGGSAGTPKVLLHFCVKTVLSHHPHTSNPRTITYATVNNSHDISFQGWPVEQHVTNTT